MLSKVQGLFNLEPEQLLRYPNRPKSFVAIPRNILRIARVARIARFARTARIADFLGIAQLLLRAFRTRSANKWLVKLP